MSLSLGRARYKCQDEIGTNEIWFTGVLLFSSLRYLVIGLVIYGR